MAAPQARTTKAPVLPPLSTFNFQLSTFPQKGKPRISWGEEIRGWGLTAEGGRRKLVGARVALPGNQRQCTWCVEIKQICRSSSYVKNVSVSSPAHSVWPSPDCDEIRLNSSSGIPNNSAARPHVTYLGTWLFIVGLLNYAGSNTIASSSTAKII